MISNRSYRAAVSMAAALACLIAVTACNPPDSSSAPGKQATQCDDTCSTQPDTVTIEVCWDVPPATRAPNVGPDAAPAVDLQHNPACLYIPTQPAWPDGAAGEITWSKAGQVVYSNTHPLSKSFHRYVAWEHDWKKQGYPEITVTADTTVSGGGVRCFITYQPEGGLPIVVLDFEQAGYRVGTGQVHCNSSVWNKLPGNAHKHPGDPA